MAEKALQPTLLVGTYDKVLFGFALHVDAPKGAPRFKPLFSAPGHLETIKSVAANSKFVCSGGQDETINVYNLRKRTELGALRQQDGSITALAFSGKFLISGASDGSLVIWKSSDWSVASILRGHKAGILSLAVHPSQKACISIGSDKKLRLWNLHTSKSAFTMPLPALCEEVMWSPSAERFALLSRTAIYVYSSTSGQLEAELKQQKPALCMTFVTEKEIAIGSEDFGIHLWDYAKGTERVHLKGHQSRVRVLRTFAVGSKTYIVSGATDGTVLVWDPAQTEAVTRIETNCRVTCLTVTMAPQPEANADDIITAAPTAAKRKIAEKEEAPADKVAKQAKTKETAPAKPTDAKKPQHKAAAKAAAKPAAAAAKATKAAPKVAVEEEADSVEDMDGSDSADDDDDDEVEAEIEAEEDGDSAGGEDEEEASE